MNKHATAYRINSPDYSYDYAKKLVKESAINSFYCYVKQTTKTILQVVPLRFLG